MKRLTKHIISMVVVLTMIVTCIPTMDAKVNAATTVPTGLTFVQNSDTSCTIAWEAISGASYDVYKAVSRYATYEKVDTVTENSYTDDAYTGGYYKIAVSGSTELSEATSYEIQTFGINTNIFEATDNIADIQAYIDKVYETTEAGQFGTDRYAFLFAPGKYLNPDKELYVRTGFYTQVAGLGLSPEDTEVDNIQVKAEWMVGKKYDGSVNYNACCNFWRSIENLTVDASFNLFAVSQATAMRRMNFTGSLTKVYEKDRETGKTISYETVKGDLYLHQDGGYASGGFLVDTKINGTISMGSQQQWLTRNTVAKEMQAAVWNNVVVGSASEVVAEDGTVSLTQMNGTQNGWPSGTNTVVEKTPIVQEKPFLMLDATDYDQDGDVSEYGVFVPAVRRDSIGVSWDGETIEGKFLNLDTFYIAKPTDSAAKINEEIASGKNLILTPGIYKISEPIVVNNNDTVVLGLGYATLEVTNGNSALSVGDVENTIVAGILFDAGPVKSDVLVTIGTEKNDKTHTDYSVALCDTFYRVGGASKDPGTCTTCVIINANDVIGDNFWVWRADHGAGVAWDKNKADHGVIINGDNVITYGLMVEHFQKEQTIWNGNNGQCYMYQSELPYDIVSQDVWNAEGSYGYASYNVAKTVTEHKGFGIGIYSCYNKATCFAESALKCPDAPGVSFTNVCSYSLAGNGGIDYAINRAGYGVYDGGEMCKIMSYCNGVYTCDREGDRATKNIIANSFTYDIDATKNDKGVYTFKYTGKAKTPEVVVKYKKIKLREGVDYTVEYKKNTDVGKGAIVITGLGNFRGTKELTTKILPAKVKVTKKKVNTKKIKLTWKKVTGADGYEVVYSTKKSFKKKLTNTIKTKKVKATIKRTVANSKYYVKVRAFKKKDSNGKKVYGKYSKVVKVNK